MIINVNRIPTITIGYLGENIVTQITFNYSQWKASYGEGTLSLVFKRNGDSMAYPIFLEHDNNQATATWTVTNTDVAKVGVAEAQLVYVVNGEAIKKSEIFTVNVKNSLENGETPPDPYQSWLNEMIRLSEETAENAESASRDAESASASAESALASAESASRDSQSASESASTASGAATNAVQSAQSANTSAQNASASASNANTSAGNARQSEQNAKTSEDNAKESEEKAREYAEMLEPIYYTDENDDGNIVIRKGE